MQADYVAFVNRMIERYEGNYGWDSSDPGGPTKYGITAWDLAEYLGQPMNSFSAWAPKVRAMTLQTADTIYADKYATACQFNALPAGSDCCVFDFLVNSGTTGIKYAQVVVGTNADGILGPITLAAIKAYDPTRFVTQLCAKRMIFLQSLSIWRTFHNGWTARVEDLRSYCLGLINPSVKATPASPYVEKATRIPGAFAKAYAIEGVPLSIN